MQRCISETSLESLESQSDDDGVQEGSATQDTSSHNVSEHLGRTVQNTTQEKKKPHDKKKVLSRQPAVGPEIYIRFEQQVRELDAELRKLGNKARALGRSAGILAASTRLRERLGRVLYLFRENALALYPVEIQEHISVHRTPVRHVRRWKTKNFLDPTIRLQAPLQDVSDSKHDSLAQEFWQLSKDVITLFECFGQYPEFLEELPDFSLAEDLQAWAKLLLDNFEHEFSGMAFQQFLFDSMPEIGARLETLAKQFIQVFTKIGIPTVKASQDHGASNLQNQTIVAALFAGVATGMIQVFTTNGTGGLHDWIVLLWYMTLIFSVASAVNGLLNLSWMQAIYRSPDSHVPWWVIIWIKRFPLVFLVLAVGCFFVALILFALTPQQNRETLIVTVALSSASCFGLIVVSGWFSCELVVYNVYGGRKWLADIIWKNNILAFVQNQWSSIWEARKKIPTVKMDLERANFQILRRDTNVIDTGSHVDLLAFAQLRHEEAAMTGTQKARARWQAAMKKVLAEERRRSRRPVPKTQMSSKLGFLMDSAPIYTSRYNTVPKLHRMTVSASHPAEDIKQAAMVRCLQFSPNGLLLVSTRWNGRSTIFHLSDKAHPACCCTFPHPDKTGYVHQVDWAPNGEKLLMRSNRKLIVWSVDGGMGEPNKTEEDQVSEELRVSMMMERKAEANELTMRSASWKPDSTGFIFAEGRRFLTINTLNQTSKLLPDNSSQHLELRSLCLSSDGLIVGTGRIVQEDARLPKQYCIIIWELSKKFKVAKKIPVFYEISNVTLASDNRSLLVSYANKAPSQLWHITYDKKAAGLDLILRHNYRIEEQTGQEVSFAPLPSIFGGENDHLVLRATMTGDIHIWDRESAKHVYCVKPPPNLQGRVTSFTWNRGSEEYMFATGMHDGTVHIWTCGERRMMSEERQQLTASPTFDSDSDSQRHDSSGGRTTLCD